jgi:hypothetical protein
MPDSRPLRLGDSAVMKPHLCQIESALGRSRECPAERCSFWQDGACVVAGLRADLTATPGLAELLLSIRERLGTAPRIDHALLPPGLR